MEEMQMTEVARLIEGLRAAGWSEKKSINQQGNKKRAQRLTGSREGGTCHRSPVMKSITYHLGIVKGRHRAGSFFRCLA